MHAIVTENTHKKKIIKCILICENNPFSTEKENPDV